MDFFRISYHFQGTLLICFTSSTGFVSPAVAQVEEEVEGGVDGDKQMIEAHQNWQPLKYQVNKTETFPSFSIINGISSLKRLLTGLQTSTKMH